MPKLYHHAANWQVPGRQDRKATRVDVPSQPAELAAWLNARRVPLEGDPFDGLVPCNAAADELLGAMRDPQLSSAADGERFWELGPPTKEPPRHAVRFSPDVGTADFVPIAHSAAIAASYGACPKCQRTWTAQVIMGISTASLDDLQVIAERIKSHVAELRDGIEEGTRQ